MRTLAQRFLNHAALLAGGAVFLAAFSPPADAGIPSPSLSTFPSHINLVGHSGTETDPNGAFEIVVRDVNNAPCPSFVVTIDFGTSPSLDIELAQSYPGMTVTSCAPPSVSATTDAFGVARFNIIGGVANHSGTSTPPASFGPTITATPPGGAPVTLGSIPHVGAFNLNGISGIDAEDLSLWLADFYSGNSPDYCDYDDARNVGANDLALLLDRWASQASREGGGSTCIGGFHPPAIILNANIGLSLVDCSNPATNSFSTDWCAANKWTDLIVSVTIPGGMNISDIVGVEATIGILGTPNTPLPAYFQFGPAGACHPLGLRGITANENSGERNCLAQSTLFPRDGETSYGGAWGYWPEPVTLATDRSRVLILNPATTQYIGPGATGTCSYSYGRLIGGVPANVAGIRITHNGPVCATSSCAVPVAFVVQEVRVTVMSPDNPGIYLPPIPCPAPFAARREGTAQPTTFVIRPLAGGANVVYANGVPSGLVLDASAMVPEEGASLGLAAPNPSSSATSMQFRLAQRGSVRIEIYDVAGRRVRSLLDGVLESGTQTVTWDGLDDSGQPVTNGAYFCRMATTNETFSRPIVWRR